MKHVFRTAIVLLLATSVAANAAPVCTPVAPAEWTEQLRAVQPGGSSAVTYFESNGCDWGNLASLNGTDGLVLEVEGHSGGGEVAAWVGRATLTHGWIGGHFLDAACARIANADFEATTASDLDPRVNPVTIPGAAKWLVLDHTTRFTPALTDLTVIVRSHGTDCPVKKPRRRR